MGWTYSETTDSISPIGARIVRNHMALYEREMPHGILHPKAHCIESNETKECGTEAPAQELMLFSKNSGFSDMATGSA